MSRPMFTTPPHRRHSPVAPLVGFISDSHGRADALAGALAFLKHRGCGTLYHLGDICDSLHPETADASVALLRKYQVNCVKGNNDHSLVVNHGGRESPSIRATTVGYLSQLPLVIHVEGGLLAHSLPFEKELGLACMVGDMTRDNARTYFRVFADRILFRGHGHSPQVACQDRHGRVVFETIPAGEAVAITKRTPCIVTCGALDRGLCLMWSPADGSVTSLRF